MSLIICPGIHHPTLTQSFLEGMQLHRDGKGLGFSCSEALLIFPAEDYPAYSAVHILQFLQTHSVTSSLVFISFSAGVVGSIGAARMWQLMGGTVKALIAIDGWGVPLFANFPIHRMSHDYFTHWSSAVLGSGEDSFYADPAVEHLDLWSSPQTAKGWWIDSADAIKAKQRMPMTAAEFLRQLLQRYAQEGG